ncbi:MAG TPA: aminotransferase class I/II-fold pyridoxal phosphate-dependent enzyme [Candidatus Angelobacter sp.]|nr:aminotransferase class I/II-fold pyridoxal phosphate-dependent enzyme [Candidatus Angelobacter sp.]
MIAGITPIAEALAGSSNAEIAGWVVARDASGVTLVDGTGSIQIKASRINADIGDLVRCSVSSNGNGKNFSNTRLVNAIQPAARDTLRHWGSGGMEEALRHRYIHLRDPEHGSALRDSWRYRQLVFDYFRERGFVYVDTPILTRTQCEYTMDDYVVVSRYSSGGVYTLPQSAQLYKQLLMGSGFWRYFQISRCFRDEPERNDSLTEFSQIDVEMSFVTEKELMDALEDFVAKMYQAYTGIELPQPFMRLPLAEALSRYGTDKPAIAQGGTPLGIFITEMPMAYRDQRGKLRPSHHPMMAPRVGIDHITPDDDLTKMPSSGFDLVLGGVEMASGNMRISDPTLQNSVLDHLGFSTEDRDYLLGTLLVALQYAFPPHGGFGVGFERLLMILTEKATISDIIAFPKIRRDWCPLTRSPFVPPKETIKACQNIFANLNSDSAHDTSVGARVAREPIAPAPMAVIVAAVAARGGCEFPMHIGDSHLPPPSSFSKVLSQSANQADMFRYSRPGGLPELRRALADRHSIQGGQKLVPENIMIGCGATECISAFVRLALTSGDRVMLLSPYWSIIRGQVKQHGCIPDEVPFFDLLATLNPTQAVSILKTNLRPSSKMVYMANPNNPDGVITPPDVVRAVADFCAAHDLWFLLDEVYEEQVFLPGHFVAGHSFDSGNGKLVTIHSFSKSMGIPGIRVGYAIGQPDVMLQLGRIMQHTTYCVPALWQHGCLAALQEIQFFETQRRVFDDARIRSAHALGVRPPAGGIYHFFQVRAEAASVAETLLRETDVALAPGTVGGSHYGSWLRMCFTSVTPDAAEEGARRSREWLRERSLLIEYAKGSTWNQ